jgi:hypothetical protein
MFPGIKGESSIVSRITRPDGIKKIPSKTTNQITGLRKNFKKVVTIIRRTFITKIVLNRQKLLSKQKRDMVMER